MVPALAGASAEGLYDFVRKGVSWVEVAMLADSHSSL
jgi:hypothetical protein